MTPRSRLLAALFFLVALSPAARGATKSVVTPAAWSTLALSPSVQAFLTTGQWDNTPHGFRIVALSFLADGCAAEARRDPTKNAAALACVDRALFLAEKTRPAKRREPTDDGLWLSHFNLMLGTRDSLSPCADPQRHQQIAKALAERTLKEPTHHVPSFAGKLQRWPADQSATLASLARYDAAHQATLSIEALKAWRMYVETKALDPKLGLPWSEATGKAGGARTPRGCALSWQTRYLHEVDDALAREWWQQYKATYLVERLGFAGFREWPTGRERPTDVDSGPIVRGVGAAATALGIGAARAMGDDSLASAMEATARLVEQMGSGLNDNAHTVIAESIRYVGTQTRP